MDSGMELLVMLLAGLAVASVVYTLIAPYLSGEKQAEKRMQSVAESSRTRGVRKAGGAVPDQAAARRKAVAETLKELEDKQKAKEKVPLRLRLQRAGLDVSVRDYWIGSAATGAALGLILFVGMPTVPPIGIAAVAFIGAFGIPRWFVGYLTKKRNNKFLVEFANSIDVIVRGVKSGLPLNECLGIIARESPSPVREEFQELIEQQRVGIPLGECFERMMSRMPLPEVKFFAIVIGIQQQAGGNLSEALGNLSGVLRDRKQLAAKVQAMSAEAKASAMVLGALPFIVMMLVYFSTPDYIMLLFTTKSGIFFLFCAAIWMTLGLLVMKKMINFKY